MFKSHKSIEKNLFILLVLTILITSIGAIVEILPLFKREVSIERVEGMRPYTPLELAGFYIYKREGCYGCHSQQVRTLKEEVERYGHYSLAAESMYDFPFQWGSKRTGPDLARVGGKYSDDWHVQHLHNPRSVVPQSIMPTYPYLHQPLNTKDLKSQLEIMKSLNVPYSKENIENYLSDIKIQAGLETDQDKIEKFKNKYRNAPIGKFDKYSNEITEMDALVSYLQSLGNKVDIETNKGRSW